MKIDLDLYQQIRHLKDIEGMSQRAIAKRLGISRTTVAKYCKGKHVPWERKDYTKRSSPVITQDVIDFILQCFAEDESHGIRKQKHTAHRIYEKKGQSTNLLFWWTSFNSIKPLYLNLRPRSRKLKKSSIHYRLYKLRHFLVSEFRL